MIPPVVRWILWAIVTVVWTVALVTEITGPSFGDTEEMRNFTRIFLAKSAHLAIYAGWTVLTGWLKAPLKVRIFLLMFLMFHAVGTEWRQTYIERSGKLSDAALDHLGIFLGVLISFRWWTAPDRS